MKNILFLLILVAVVVYINKMPPKLLREDESSYDSAEWLEGPSRFKEAKDLAKLHNASLLVYVYDPKCPACTWFDQELLISENMTDLNSIVKFRMYGAKKDRPTYEVNRELRLNEYPWFVVMHPDSASFKHIKLGGYRKKILINTASGNAKHYPLNADALYRAIMNTN